MARYTGAVCRLCRREGQKLFLKGERCYSDKCGVVRRSYAPGQHGQNRKKISEYGVQFRAKQKARRFYGVLEGQLERYFDMAVRAPGMTGENLLRILESRLDNVVYRLGLCDSRPQARQFVRHNHVTVNGTRVNIPSYLVKAGDVISITDKTRASESFKNIVEANSSRPVPKWLDMNKTTLSATVVSLPSRDEVDLDVEEHMIVELYSK